MEVKDLGVQKLLAHTQVSLSSTRKRQARARAQEVIRKESPSDESGANVCEEEDGPEESAGEESAATNTSSEEDRLLSEAKRAKAAKRERDHKRYKGMASLADKGLAVCGLPCSPRAWGTTTRASPFDATRPSSLGGPRLGLCGALER
jgi:hypothetical protein